MQNRAGRRGGIAFDKAKPGPLAARDRQAGAALLTVLLITALVTVTAVAMVKDQQIDIRRTANVIDHDQAYLLARGVENWAKVVLERDSKLGSTDTLADVWAQPLVPTSVEGGTIAAELVDLSGRFNLNNLASKDSGARESNRKRFRRLLALCNAESLLVETVMDWVDEDRVIMGTTGVEDDLAWKQDRLVRTANRPMARPSELLLVPGIEIEAYTCLAPAVAALPLSGEEKFTKINVNTAPALVVAALADNLSLEDAENLVENRGRQGFKSVDEFLDKIGLAGDGLKEYLDVKSAYFLATAKAVVGRGDCTLFSLLHRPKNNKVQVLGRSIGTF